LPASKDVKDLLEDLLGRTVSVRQGDPVRAADLLRTHLSLYVDDVLHLAAVVGLDLPLAVSCGAALGLLPARAAQDSIDDGQLTPALAENVGEVCTALNELISHGSQTPVRLYETFLPGQPLPADAAGHLMALGRRLDLQVDVSGYSSGRFSVVLVS
jgi:hypothetical protein